MHRHDHERVGEEADRDRWSADQDVARQPDPARPGIDRIFGNVDAPQDPDRDRHQRREADQDPGPHDGVGYPTTGDAERAKRVREELDGEHGRKALADGKPEDQAERDESQHGQQIHDAQPRGARITPADVSIHAARLASREVERTSSRATVLTTRVTRMRTSPSSISAAG